MQITERDDTITTVRNTAYINVLLEKNDAYGIEPETQREYVNISLEESERAGGEIPILTQEVGGHSSVSLEEVAIEISGLEGPDIGAIEERAQETVHDVDNADTQEQERAENLTSENGDRVQETVPIYSVGNTDTQALEKAENLTSERRDILARAQETVHNADNTLLTDTQEQEQEFTARQ